MVAITSGELRNSAAAWGPANHRSLIAELAVVREVVRRWVAEPSDAAQHDDAVAHARAEAAACDALLPAPSSLQRLTTAFGLSAFERDVLLMCAGVELDRAFAELLATIGGAGRGAAPTFSLALAALAGAHWSALTPAAPLRNWRLIKTVDGGSPTMSPLRIDERILHYLAGVTYLDERLRNLARPVAPPSAPLPPSHAAHAERIAAMWSAPGFAGTLRVRVCGDRVSVRAIAATASMLAGMDLHAIDVRSVPADADEAGEIGRLWDREARLNMSALLLEDDGSLDLGRVVTADWLAARVTSPLMLTGAGSGSAAAPAVRIDIAAPTMAEQRELWQRALGSAASTDAAEAIDAAVAHFSPAPDLIRAAAAEAVSDAPGSTLGAALWNACRLRTRPDLDRLAQRIDSRAGWDDLILPEQQRAQLRAIALHVRRRSTVYDDWGFAAKTSRGLGITALFAGRSGTGKTLAAEVLANELQLDAYRIDLSAVVSKYIGETEKQLRRLFEAAESAGAILLFDEADALFAKRSAVNDSHDRYANIEVSYLLTQMEAYRGLAILTTNMRSAFDAAFVRRIRFVVEFSFPDAVQRAAIWRAVIPPKTPAEALDFNALGRLNVTGGSIRNIVLNAAFLAAGEGVALNMRLLLDAARTEAIKLEQPLDGCSAL